jgi:hypothetical protein
MSIEDEMTINERRKYLHKIQKRYREADQKAKGRLLDEMEQVTELDRKYLITLLGSNLKRKARRRQRGRTYGPEVDDALRVIDESFDYICPERLTPNLVWMAEHLAQHGELETSRELLEKLGQISISTVKRILRRIRQDQPRLPRKRPRRANKLVRDIPMRRIPWDTPTPGHFEVDLVHHSGPTTCGEYMCTLQIIDIATGWSERVAVLGRSYRVMQHAFRLILCRLPFRVREIHPDNGSEFLNHHMLRFWGEIVQGITLSRSRPFHKNDNCHVEQKNATLVRAYLGDDRLDSVAQTLVANQLLEQMWIYYNLFQPVMHLQEKQVIPQNGHPPRIRRRYDEARTPFDRLCATDAILPEHRKQLEALRDQINPRLFRQQIYATIDHLFSLPGATPEVVEDIHETLVAPALSGAPGRTLLDFAFNRTPVVEGAS